MGLFSEMMDDIGDKNREIARLQTAIAEIERIVHTPTPGKMGAYTHFMRDFDQIRALCRAAISSGVRGTND